MRKKEVGGGEIAIEIFFPGQFNPIPTICPILGNCTSKYSLLSRRFYSVLRWHLALLPPTHYHWMAWIGGVWKPTWRELWKHTTSCTHSQYFICRKKPILKSSCKNSLKIWSSLRKCCFEIRTARKPHYQPSQRIDECCFLHLSVWVWHLAYKSDKLVINKLKNLQQFLNRPKRNGAHFMTSTARVTLEPSFATWVEGDWTLLTFPIYLFFS